MVHKSDTQEGEARGLFTGDQTRLCKEDPVSKKGRGEEEEEVREEEEKGEEGEIRMKWPRRV